MVRFELHDDRELSFWHDMPLVNGWMAYDVMTMLPMLF